MLGVEEGVPPDSASPIGMGTDNENPQQIICYRVGNETGDWLWWKGERQRG